MSGEQQYVVVTETREGSTKETGPFLTEVEVFRAFLKELAGYDNVNVTGSDFFFRAETGDGSIISIQALELITA